MFTTRPEIDAVIAETCSRCNKPDLAPTIRWSFNARFTRRMGDARPLALELRFSTPLWPRATDEQRHSTIVHETCHLLAGPRPFGGPHGLMWQSYMRLAGARPDRCHTVDRTGLKRTLSITLTCPCGIVLSIGPRIRSRILAGAICRCRRCRQPVDRAALAACNPVSPSSPNGITKP